MKKMFKKISAIAIIIVVIMSCLSVNAFAVSNYVAETELDTVSSWVNNKGVSNEGVILRDVWAVDNTGISKAKYVLLNENGLEVMRVENYPGDIDAGKTIQQETYKGTISLKVPEGTTGEISVVLTNDVATYNLYFNEEDSYKITTDFIPGSYLVTEMVVLSDDKSTFSVDENFVFDVKSDKTSAVLELIKTANVEVEETKSNNAIVQTFSSYDKNGDLVSDTIQFVVALLVILVIYGFIIYRRKKMQEIK